MDTNTELKYLIKIKQLPGLKNIKIYIRNSIYNIIY